jgi:ankyrin repeat protein
MSPLMLAAKYGTARSVELLLSRSPEGAREMGASGVSQVAWTPLMYAADVGTEQAAEVLLSASDPDAVDARGNNALMIAAAAGSARLVEMLLAATKPARDKMGRSALMRAASNGGGGSGLREDAIGIRRSIGGGLRWIHSLDVRGATRLSDGLPDLGAEIGCVAALSASRALLRNVGVGLRRRIIFDGLRGCFVGLRAKQCDVFFEVGPEACR